MTALPLPIVALDVSTQAEAMALVDRLDGLCGFYKVGLQLYTAEGPGVVKVLRGRGADVFLDLKLHDIPNTVRGGVERAAALGARLVTVHASGGSAMLEAAQQGASAAGTECGVLAVTVLTSLDAAGLAEVWGRQVSGLDVTAEVVRLAGLAESAGLHGVVCSGHEAAAVSARYERLATLVPGIRLSDGAAHDQARVMTPGKAAAVGASYIVLGRAVTADPDPRAAMRRVLSELGKTASAQGA